MNDIDLTDAVAIMERVPASTWGRFASNTSIQHENGDLRHNWYRPGIAESRESEFGHFKVDLAEGKPLAINHFAQFIAWRMNRGDT